MLRRILISLCNVAALYESVLGLRQVLGLARSNHAGFVMTGSFANPGPYGGCIGVLLATLAAYVVRNRSAVRWQDKGLLWLSAISCMLCLVVLPATMSRAACLGFGVAAAVFGFKELAFGSWLKRHKAAACAITAAAMVAMTGAFFLKRDSAIGRLHIWHMELRAMAQKPWTGHGGGTVLGVYGDTQAAYFAEATRPETIIRVAGCPEYAFNEYFRVGVEHGVPAMFATMAAVACLIALLLRLRSELAYGAIVLAVFAFFSYPTSCMRIRSDAQTRWEALRYLNDLEMYEDAAVEFEKLYPDMKDNYRFLYDYGYALFKCGRSEESIEVLTEGARISSDPMFHNIIGRNCESLGRYGEAERHYMHSHHMVPARLYPLSLLMRMKAELGCEDEAAAYAREMLSMPCNERHPGMLKIRKEAADFLHGQEMFSAEKATDGENLKRHEE